MVQGVSLASLTASGNCGVYGLIMPKWRHFKLSRKIHGQCPLHQCVQGLQFIGNPNILRRRNLRVEAGWLFNKEGEQELDASSERSESANEDILIFFFQLDLATRVQYALNVEQYDIAQQLRNKLTEVTSHFRAYYDLIFNCVVSFMLNEFASWKVEAEVIGQQEAKRGSSSKSEAQDKAIRIIRLRADLQTAIENENYAVAAELRDQISELEAESLAASAKALVYENAHCIKYVEKESIEMYSCHGSTSEEPNVMILNSMHAGFSFPDTGSSRFPYWSNNYNFHRCYRAVVCGMDPVCCESSSWMETAHVEKLARGSSQPFYQVQCISHFVVGERLKGHAFSPASYVPEENLVAPEKPDQGRFDHPYISFLFYGMDTAGDFIPIKQLREKYSRPRHEVPIDPPDDDNGGGGGDG
ncbi:unnamed protein product [Dovyalis caffra]|uniref:UVR domain-containing protein n=1 Tax=Dovyalis caffra TaxID=77055 RepID=A0AAV1QZF9_9ROSI|nr:unnamed protein product [Dovyalis caffra]